MSNGHSTNTKEGGGRGGKRKEGLRMRASVYLPHRLTLLTWLDAAGTPQGQNHEGHRASKLQGIGHVSYGMALEKLVS